jgi:hypothetical protein
MPPAEDAAFRAAVDASSNGASPVEVRAAHVATLEEFIAVDEPGADPLLGSGDDALIPEGGDVMVYGDGGAGKTTLTIDAAFHLAAGDAWLGIRVARPVRLLIIENEGPRALFRSKLRRKLAAWTGSPLEGRVSIFEEPWGEFTFTDDGWRHALAARVREDAIDALLVGPVTRTGMNEAGTLQEVRDFLRLVAAVRVESGRRLVVILVHHENKGGAVSGAWEGSGDTLLHVEARGNGHTHLHVQKARWSSAHHGTSLELGWTDGEGFKVEDARNYQAEVEALLADGTWRTAREIANKRDHPDKPGIGASSETVRATLKEHPDTFIERKGKEVGRSPQATCYGLNPTQSSVSSVGDLQRADEGDGTTALPLRDAVAPSAAPPTTKRLNSPPSSVANTAETAR